MARRFAAEGAKVVVNYSRSSEDARSWNSSPDRPNTVFNP
jgi:NAD(P)-dependent dehydrogenase (short-subunit alcohol dehydrogenase family)